MAAKHKKVPAIIHESDITSGLANKLCLPSATKVCVNFPETLNALPAAASRGDQILNANFFKKQGFSFVIEEEQLSSGTLLDAVNEVYKDRQTYVDVMSKSPLSNAVEEIVKLILALS